MSAPDVTRLRVRIPLARRLPRRPRAPRRPEARHARGRLGVRGHRDRLPRGASAEGPALLFENVRGARFPLAVNVLAARRRIEWALGRTPASGRRRARGDPPRRAAAPARRPVEAARQRAGACWRCGRGALGAGPGAGACARRRPRRRCPILQLWPKDGGRFVTFALVLTEHPETRGRNLGIYRMHVYDARTTGMHWQIGKGGGFHYHHAEKRGRALEVAVAVGADPGDAARRRGAAARGHRRAGVRRLPARRADAARARPHARACTCPPTPSSCSRAWCRRGERRERGSVRRSLRPLLARRAVPGVPRAGRSRTAASPVYQASVVGKPPQEDKFMGEAVQEFFTGVLQVIHPEVARPVGLLRGRLPQPARGRGREPLRQGGDEDRARPDGHRAALAHQGDRAGGRGREPARPRRGVRRDRAATSIPPRTSCCCPACRSTRSTSRRTR